MNNYMIVKPDGLIVDFQAYVFVKSLGSLPSQRVGNIDPAAYAPGDSPDYEIMSYESPDGDPAPWLGKQKEVTEETEATVDMIIQRILEGKDPGPELIEHDIMIDD